MPEGKQNAFAPVSAGFQGSVVPAMILILTADYDPHADVVTKKLKSRGLMYARFDTADFPLRTIVNLNQNRDHIEGWIQLPEGRLDLASIRTIWYRRPRPCKLDPSLSPEHSRFARGECEHTLEGLWSALRCSWVSRPQKIREASRKIYQLTLAAALGLNTPRSLVTADPEEARVFFDACKGKMICKPLSNSFIEYPEHRTGIIYTRPLTRTDLSKLPALRHSPCLFQEYVPKQVELRITVIGAKVFAAEIHSQGSERTRHDWRRYDFQNTPYYPHSLPPNVEQLCSRMVQELGLAFGAIDMILTPDGQYVFLEINPNGQWYWIEMLTGLPLCETFVDLLADGIAD